ncbi:MAG TPA: V-type ATP synthase subunit E [Nitrospiria bacterium]|nr:V-type ATP synthase subunit E [Nitrospiria bacterium]
MGYEELIGDLRRGTELKKEGALTAAREQARQIIEDAMRQCDRLEREFQDSIARDLDQERTRLLNRARREARLEWARVRSDLMREVFGRLEEKLKAVASEKRYPMVLERLLSETRPEWPEGEIVIRADSKTLPLLKSLVGNGAFRFEPMAGTGEDPYGGFELSDGEYRVVIRNTLRSRLLKARSDLLVEANRVLFENDPRG